MAIHKFHCGYCGFPGGIFKICWCSGRNFETFEKCSILVKIKEGENFNHRNILDISRIEI